MTMANLKKCVNNSRKEKHYCKNAHSLLPAYCLALRAVRFRAEAKKIAEKRTIMTQNLLKALPTLPSHWPLIPINNNKQPLGWQWQHHPFTPAQLYNALSQGFVTVKGKTEDYRVKPQGIGLLCGINSQEFLFAVDCDGFSAYSKLQQISQGEPLPDTVSFTSGRTGRCQYLFKLPLSQSIKSIKINTSKGEKLEIRGTHHQSVLPPSVHPTTRQYHWVNSPIDTEVAIAPSWLVQWIESRRHRTQSPPVVRHTCQTFPKSSLTSSDTSVEAAIALLNLIPSSLADDYDSWIRVGMALKYISDSLLPEWDRWSQSSPKYKPGECAYKWQSFRGSGISDRTLHYLAKK